LLRWLGLRISRRRFVKRALQGTVAVALALWAAYKTRPDVGQALAGERVVPMPVGPTAPSHAAIGPARLRGRVVDILSRQPIAGARVEAGALAQTTGADGLFNFKLEAGLHRVQVSAPGYITTYIPNHRIVAGAGSQLDFEMLPERVSPDQEEALYAAAIRAPGPPLPLSMPAPGEAISGQSVPCQIKVRWPDGSEQMMDLEEYLKWVVPAEMPSSWPIEALKAQAVAARSYAVSYYLANGYVCTTAACQVYGNTRYTTTDQAVDATRGVVATYQGVVIRAFFFAKCNSVSTRNSEDAVYSADGWKTCQSGPWSVVPYCRSRPCVGHTPHSSDCGYYGHGVGMCQWGAKARAGEGLAYGDIISRYYTGIALQTLSCLTLVSPPDGYILRAGTSPTFNWSGSAAQYQVVIYNEAGAQVAASGWLAASSWSGPALAAGTYSWEVQVSGASTERRKLVVAATVYTRTFPVEKTGS